MHRPSGTLLAPRSARVCAQQQRPDPRHTTFSPQPFLFQRVEWPLAPQRPRPGHRSNDTAWPLEAPAQQRTLTVPRAQGTRVNGQAPSAQRGERTGARLAPAPRVEVPALRQAELLRAPPLPRLLRGAATARADGEPGIPPASSGGRPMGERPHGHASSSAGARQRSRRTSTRLPGVRRPCCHDDCCPYNCCPACSHDPRALNLATRLDRNSVRYWLDRNNVRRS